MATVNINLGLTAAAAGTVDAITATYSPVPTLFNRLTLYFEAAGANTSTTPTFNPNSLGAKTIVKKNNQALVAGDIAGQYFVAHVQYNSTLDKWVLINPASDAADTYWEAGAGLNSLKDKRSTASSADDGFAAGREANNSGSNGQAIGAGATNSVANGQAIGSDSNNSAEGQSIGHGAVNSGQLGQSIGHGSSNSGLSGQAIGDDAVNAFARSTALGYQSVSTDDDQMNLSQTVRLQDYTGGNKLLILDADKLVVETTAIPNNTTATTQSANDNSTKVATTAYVDTGLATKAAKTFVENISLQDASTGIADQTYTLELYAQYAYTINELKIISDAGTCNAAVKINGTDVTGISAVAVSSVIATGTATAANTVAVGNKITLVISTTSGLNNLQASLKTTRI